MAATVRVGVPAVVESYSDTTTYGAVFEDDGETGYFYGLDRRLGEEPILDALHIYDVASVRDRATPNEVVIEWSRDGVRVALLINGYPHAVFDFAERRGHCRTGVGTSRWVAADHRWTDRAVQFLDGAI